MNIRPSNIFDLLSVCESELLQAEKFSTTTISPQGNAEDEFKKKGSASTTVIETEVFKPLLPPSVTDRFHEAMHEALMKIMAERDEAHAHLIASNVLHIHQLEQERRKNERLQIELKIAEEMKEVQIPNVAQFFGAKVDDKRRKELEEKIEAFERILGKNQDDDIDALCHQLAGEISAKTSNALEIIRLKETREIERKNELSEKLALKEELKRVNELLAAEKKKHADAIEEAAHWKSSYENVLQSRKSTGSSD